MSKITAFTDNTPEVITEETHQQLVEQFINAADKAQYNGEIYQRVWLFASKDPDVICDMNEWVATGCDIINEDLAAKDKLFIGKCKKVAIAGAVIGVAVFGYKKWKARKAKKLQNEKAEDKLRHAFIKAKNVQNEEAKDNE